MSTEDNVASRLVYAVCMIALVAVIAAAAYLLSWWRTP